MMKHAANASTWAIGAQRRNGFHVRKVMWGLLMAQCERRHGEQIRAASIMVEKHFKRRKSVLPVRKYKKMASEFIEYLAPETVTLRRDA